MAIMSNVTKKFVSQCLPGVDVELSRAPMEIKRICEAASIVQKRQILAARKKLIGELGICAGTKVVYYGETYTVSSTGEKDGCVYLKEKSGAHLPQNLEVVA